MLSTLAGGAYALKFQAVRQDLVIAKPTQEILDFPKQRKRNVINLTALDASNVVMVFDSSIESLSESLLFPAFE